MPLTLRAMKKRLKAITKADDCAVYVFTATRQCWCRVCDQRWPIEGPLAHLANCPEWTRGNE